MAEPSPKVIFDAAPEAAGVAKRRRSSGTPPRLSWAADAAAALDAERMLRLAELNSDVEALCAALGAAEEPSLSATPSPQWSTPRESSVDHHWTMPVAPRSPRASEPHVHVDAALDELLAEAEAAAQEAVWAETVDVSASVEALARRLSHVIAAAAQARAQEELSAREAAVAAFRRARAARCVVRHAKGCPLLLRFHARRRAAATSIQAHARGMLARQRRRDAAAAAKAEAGAALRAAVLGQLSAAEQLRRRHAAAATLQRGWRCYVARVRVARLREQKRAAAAATRIQAVWRGHALRTRLARAMEAIMALQQSEAVPRHDVTNAAAASSSEGVSEAGITASSIDDLSLYPPVDESFFTPQPVALVPAREPTPPPPPPPSPPLPPASPAPTLGADEGGAASVEPRLSPWEEAELHHKAAVEKAKCVWGFESDAVADAFVRVAARTKALHAKHNRSEKMRDPAQRMEALRRHAAAGGGAVSPPRNLSPAKRDAAMLTAAAAAHATAAVETHRSAAANIKAAVRGERSPVRALPNVTLGAGNAVGGAKAARFNETLR